ncbi:MAG: hypothetical protein HQM10_18320 [Candidatus Riflebacteria bacterium]|nr:hypothetical protein [Candidatus Riflebacteria bacterium]
MKKIYSVLLCFLMVVFTNSASALSDWTIAIYMSNEDNSSTMLEDSNIDNLLKMTKAISPGLVNIVVQADRGKLISDYQKEIYKNPNYRGALRYSIQPNSLVEEEVLGEVNMGSPYTLWNFMKWAAVKYPSKHFCLIINSHGSGVFSPYGPGSISDSKPGSVNFDPSRFVASDGTSGDCLTIFEVAAVTRAFRDRLNAGKPIDIAAFDACLPGMVEVLYQLRDSTRLMVGSAGKTGITGFAYRAITEKLSEEPSISAENLAKFISDQDYSQLLGAWQTAKAEELAFEMNNFARECIQAMKTTAKKFVIENLATYEDKNRYCDIFSLASSIQEGTCNFNGASNQGIIRAIAGEILETLTAANLREEGGNLTVAWPQTTEYKAARQLYKALEFSAQTNWDEMLDLHVLGIK